MVANTMIIPQLKGDRLETDKEFEKRKQRIIRKIERHKK